MQLEAWAANNLAEAMALMLGGGRVDVFDSEDNRLASCQFADPPFNPAADGQVEAFPLPAARGLSDGAPVRFEAFAVTGDRVLAGSAGYKDALPAPEMKFRTRVIVEDADVLVESFIFSLADIAAKDGIPS